MKEVKQNSDGSDEESIETLSDQKENWALLSLNAMLMYV